MSVCPFWNRQLDAKNSLSPRIEQLDVQFEEPTIERFRIKGTFSMPIDAL
jgi:hypothetical protein